MIKEFKENYNLSDEDLEKLEIDFKDWFQKEQDKDILSILKFIKNTYNYIIKKSKFKNITIFILLCKLTDSDIKAYLNA